MSKKRGEPTFMKRDAVSPKPARWTGGAPLDPDKPPLFISEKSREIVGELLKDYGKFHRMARKVTTGRA